jgi:hypothetical protein
MIVAGSKHYGNDLAAVTALRDILLERVEGRLAPDKDADYSDLRRELMHHERYKAILPKVVKDNDDLGGIWSVLRGVSDQWEPRRQFIREQMRGLMEAADASVDFDFGVPTSASAWTGIASATERLHAARQLIPFAQASIDGLLAELERPTGNGGPPLDHRQEAIENLRLLHDKLGDILRDIQDGKLNDTLGSGLAAEAARYAVRAARALRDDPMPYLISGTIIALLGTFGIGDPGSYLAGVAMTFTKNTRR